MRKFKTDTDLVRMLQKNLLVGHNNKAGGIMTVVVDLLPQNFQSVQRSRVGAADCRMVHILLLHNLACRNRSIRYADLLHCRMVIQIFLTLHQPLRMGIDSCDLILFAPLQSRKYMADRKHGLSHDIIFIFYKQIVYLIHCAC